jgi:membrane protein implicated in regulation of membrane protease activity
MYLVAIAWLYVTLMMALAEAIHPNGTLLGAFVTLMLYGVGPLSLVLYLMGTPLRRKKRLADEPAQDAPPP